MADPSAANRKLPVAIAVLVLAIVIAVFNLGRKPKYGLSSTDEWYYDLNEKTLFTGPADVLPPIETPSGPAAGVRAYVYACGDCSDPGKHIIAYLARYGEDSKQKISALREQAKTAPPEQTAALIAEADSYVQLHQQVSIPDAGTWISMQQGDFVSDAIQRVTNQCVESKQTAVPCRPTMQK